MMFCSFLFHDIPKNARGQNNQKHRHVRSIHQSLYPEIAPFRSGFLLVKPPLQPPQCSDSSAHPDAPGMIRYLEESWAADHAPLVRGAARAPTPECYITVLYIYYYIALVNKVTSCPIAPPWSQHLPVRVCCTSVKHIHCQP